MAAGAAGRRPMRASDADREQAIEVLKDAFAHGQLTKDELVARAGRALAARTCARLAALTADIPPARAAPIPSERAVSIPSERPADGPPERAASGSARPPVPAQRGPLPRAAAKSGGCLAVAGAAVWASFILDPGGPGVDRPWAGLMLLVAQYAAIAGVWILWSGVATAVQQRRSARRLPPRPAPGARPPGVVRT